MCRSIGFVPIFTSLVPPPTGPRGSGARSFTQRVTLPGGALSFEALVTWGEYLYVRGCARALMKEIYENK